LESHSRVLIVFAINEFVKFGLDVFPVFFQEEESDTIEEEGDVDSIIVLPGTDLLTSVKVFEFGFRVV
jgi:hypothetical protein